MKAAERETVIEPSAGPAKKKKFLKLLLKVCMVIAVSVLIWEEFLEDRLVAKRWGVVEPGKIYRSGQISSYLIEPVLLENKIEKVIALNGSDLKKPYLKTEVETARKLNIDHQVLHLIGDGTGDVEDYAEAVAEIMRCEKAGKPVLVHCAAGAQRTGGVVAAYRMLVQKKTPEEAYQELLEYNWKPHKDQALINYLNQNLATLSKLLEQKIDWYEPPATIPVIGK
ncbi:MAG: dual specificity protein phosphatase family protein [Planctomycetes bacterium]|nr:dual specificity protein phosphatase family protein [Planctomycetota bacterium]MCH9727329.1 dual specificity protein phosphatase family protein [Planctomycetota bacterium]MCH9777011.1 dual specificity protein phosphatase family protein [Planctomycetota bacterium]MCH9792102.1 dual specificity protein phosphatase family protein [Planctomycetota bacterium]MDF1745141.1 dual specificity protein phosphatase family protein [Gimesia sp.]